MARALGINHVALEVDDLERCVAFYREVFGFELRGRVPGMAFLDMGDQFLALAAGRRAERDADRHFGLVVDDLDDARAALERAGAELLPSRGLDFLDPAGNRVQVVDYRDVQFTKTARALESLGATGIEKSDAALAELRKKGLA